jgi:O-antigen polymerase
LEYTGILTSFNSYFEITGGFLNPGACANFMAAIMPFSFAAFLFNDTKQKSIKIISLIAFLTAIIMLLVMDSRTAWIAGFVSIIFLLASHDKLIHKIKTIFSNKTGKILLSVFIIVCISSIIFVYWYKKDSAHGRLFIWKTCLHIIKDKPVFGHGYGSFITTYNNYQLDYFKNNPDDEKNGLLANEATFAFNDYLQITIESGITGLLLFLGIIVFSLGKQSQEDKSSHNVMIKALKACIVSMLVCALFSYPFQSAIIKTLFYISIACISATQKPVFMIQYKNALLKRIVFSISAIVLIFIIYNEIATFKYSGTWKKAHISYNEGEHSKSFDLYKIVYPKLKNNFFFLFNYGLSLCESERFNEAISILEKVKNGQNNYQLLLALGDSYAGINDFEQAEKNYLNAAFLIPHMYVPRYKLFKLYRQTNQTEKANDLAVKINAMKIKVYSTTVSKIKGEILDYLKTENITDIK